MKEDSAEPLATVSLRATTADDQAFLLKAYAGIRRDELAQVPWTDAQREAFIKMQFDAQQAHYRTHNPDATHDIILLGGQAVGRLYVARRESEIRILDITILREYRGRGTGTLLIEGLVKEAAAAGKPLSIYVESFNPSLRLFERLGFKQKEEDGVLLLMEWRASEDAHL
jgi:GNAT superfamily N-acetyltransferase